jgi:hypothetical protein
VTAIAVTVPESVPTASREWLETRVFARVGDSTDIACVEPFASFEKAEEHVLPRVERFILIAQKLSTASQHHRPVPAAGVFNIQLLHAGCITPRSRRSVTAENLWWT